MLFIFEFVAYMLQEKAVSIPNLLKMLIFVSTDWQTDGAIILPLAVHARARDNNMMCLASRTDSVCFGHNSVLFLAEHNPQIYAWCKIMLCIVLLKIWMMDVTTCLQVLHHLVPWLGWPRLPAYLHSISHSLLRCRCNHFVGNLLLPWHVNSEEVYIAHGQ